MIKIKKAHHPSFAEAGIAFREGEITLTNMPQAFCRDPDGYGVEFIALKK